MRQEKTAEPAVAIEPAYYEVGYWKRWSRVYDSLVKLFFLPFGGELRFRDNFVDFASPREGEQVLDACCGTGTVTSLVARRVGGSGRVIGIDLSAEMIARARKKATNLPVIFKRASCDRLPFPEDTFDRSLVSFGLHELPLVIRQNSLKEIYRTLKPGGSLFIFDYHLPEGLWPRLAIKSFVKFFEEEVAYRLMLEDRLPAEIGDAGFILRERRWPLAGMFQMLRAQKPGQARADG